MLSEERIILMTRMASYERGEGRENVKIGNYFRADYIALHVLKAVVCAIISFGILFGLYMLCNIEEFLEDQIRVFGSVQDGSAGVCQGGADVSGRHGRRLCGPDVHRLHMAVRQGEKEPEMLLS